MFAPFNGLKSLVARLHRSLTPSLKPKSVKNRPAQRTVLTLEALEARENPSALVPFTSGGTGAPGGGQPVANNVNYLLPGGPKVGRYELESNGTLLNLSTGRALATNVFQEAALYNGPYGETLAALSGTKLFWTTGPQNCNVTSFVFSDGNVLSTNTSSSSVSQVSSWVRTGPLMTFTTVPSSSTGAVRLGTAPDIRTR